MNSGDTIAAISSGVGAAARMIVRASGSSAYSIAHGLAIGREPANGAAFRCVIRFNGLAVPATAYTFRTPHSYTGEDLIELHIPGSPVLGRMLLEAIYAFGVRAAEPGEFTARAYFNGRIDLTEAEGVAATISAGNEQELSAARRLLGGELARRLAPVLALLTDTLALVEVGIDFTGEDVTFLSDEQELARVREADAALERLVLESAQFERLAHEPVLVLVGRPNAGKSTLLNALAGRDRAVVSSVAGTTRDALSAEVVLAHGIVRVVDVAGIDESESATEIDRQMRSQALRAVEEADVVVLVEDRAVNLSRLDLPRAPALVVKSKSDLVVANESARECETFAELDSHECDVRANATFGSARATLSLDRPANPARQEPRTPLDEIEVSALTGAGMAQLRSRLDQLCFGDGVTGSAALSLNVRHLRAIEEARAALARAQKIRSPELLALELREALDALGGILGKVTPDDVLGRIFAGFCIGK